MKSPGCAYLYLVGGSRMTDIKLCINCRHCKLVASTYECERAQIPDYVMGVHQYRACARERAWVIEGKCGPDAQYFEAREASNG